MDAARTASGLAQTYILYTEEVRQSFRPEQRRFTHAKEEGISSNLLTNPVEILTDDKWLGERHEVYQGWNCEPDASGEEGRLP